METIFTGMFFYFRSTSGQFPVIQFSILLPVLLPVLFFRIINNVWYSETHESSQGTILFPLREDVPVQNKIRGPQAKISSPKM